MTPNGWTLAAARCTLGQAVRSSISQPAWAPAASPELGVRCLQQADPLHRQKFLLAREQRWRSVRSQQEGQMLRTLSAPPSDGSCSTPVGHMPRQGVSFGIRLLTYSAGGGGGG